MDEEYLIARMRASLEMARCAAGSAARLIHFELAGRYGLALARPAIDHPRVWLQSLRPGVSSFHDSSALACPA